MLGSETRRTGARRSYRLVCLAVSMMEMERGRSLN